MDTHTLAISVIVPHYSGEQLFECLDALLACPDQPAEIILVDDCSVDGTSEAAARRYPGLRMLRNPANLGFVGACNRGLAEAAQPFAALLNDDALVEPGWLDVCLAALEADPSIAAVQPKIVRAQNPSTFDYAGGAGGLIDRYAYPYALGRWFDRLETDTGQYDTPREIFWASGTAIAMRMDAVRTVGLLDRALQMHMEEIDWCWRAITAGYRIVNAPSARVRHYGAATLKADSFRKMYLNHRNSFMLILKNYSILSVLWIAPLRFLLELLTVAGSLATGNVRRALAAFLAPFAAAVKLPHILHERRRIAKLRRRPDWDVATRMYRGSIAIRYLLRLGSPSPEGAA
jgi:GT2 family glycosyltransferase